jgi:hypothetical protein
MHVAAYRARQRSAADGAAITDDEVTVSVG